MAPSPASTAQPAAPTIIRFAEQTDIQAMREIYAPYVATPVTFDEKTPAPAQFAARMAAVMPAYPCLVLERNGRVAGFAYAHAQAERAAYRWNAELSVYLEQGATGRGWGGALYEALLSLLGMQGIKSAYALVTIPNAASEHLHESLGFKLAWVQTSAGWKNGAWRDVAWYVKALAPFEGHPTDPTPFDEIVRARPNLVRAVLDRTNAALAQG